MSTLQPTLTPRGHLCLMPVVDVPPLEAGLAARIERAFVAGAGHGLLHLGAAEVTTALPPVWAWWRDFAARYVTALTATPDGGEIAVSVPDAPTLETWVLDAPPMIGAEYLTPAVLAALWVEIEGAVKTELVATGVSLQEFLKARHPAWNLVGRVHFNLAENRKDPEAPFAFLATYTTRLSAHGKAQHLPLSQALAEFSGAKKKAQLLSLLLPVQRAAEQCDWLAEMVESGEIYHPLRWEVADVVRFLHDLPRIEAAGIVVRMPAQWQAIVQASAGSIASLVELLQGKFSKAVMERLCQPNTGLFPSPKEIELNCSCPDWARMCKHVAAVLYGVGTRLDEKPELLFTLRQVDAGDLVTQVAELSVRPKKAPAKHRRLDDAALVDVFGIELGEVPVAVPTQPKKPSRLAKKRCGAG